jgi:hypothetical protein
MRILVCGGRDYSDRQKVYDVLNDYHSKRSLYPLGITAIIHGGAKGADTLAHDWAKCISVSIEMYPADWEKHGRAAGAIRNKQMLDEGLPDLVIAFPGGRGTANMVDQATKAGVKVILISELANSQP